MKPNKPNAEEFQWLVVSEYDVLVFDKNTDICYGCYTRSDPIDFEEETFRISSAWKNKLSSLNDIQAEYVKDLNAKISSFQ
jgi:hypothetical protein